MYSNGNQSLSSMTAHSDALVYRSRSLAAPKQERCQYDLSPRHRAFVAESYLTTSPDGHRINDVELPRVFVLAAGVW